MPSSMTFEQLVAEGEAVPLDGWDFSWFGGRATEGRPSWGYARLLVPRVAAAEALLDIATGGGEVLAEVLAKAARRPPVIAATEAWPPNLLLARRALARFGATVVEADGAVALPFGDGSFDLVVSRHPARTNWGEISRVLRPGGSYLSQQVGAGSNRELYELLMGPQPPNDARSERTLAQQAEAAGLRIVDLREERLHATFGDIGAVVHFLRKVPWTVPDFSVPRYRDRLAELHERIERQGPFVTHPVRVLIEATKPV